MFSPTGAWILKKRWETGRRSARASGAACRVRSQGSRGGNGTDMWPLARSQVKKKNRRENKHGLSYLPTAQTTARSEAGASPQSEMRDLFSVYTEVRSTDIYIRLYKIKSMSFATINLSSREETCLQRPVPGAPPGRSTQRKSNTRASHVPTRGC